MFSMRKHGRVGIIRSGVYICEFYRRVKANLTESPGKFVSDSAALINNICKYYRRLVASLLGVLFFTKTRLFKYIENFTIKKMKTFR